MSREAHVQFCESVEGRLLCATHLVILCQSAEQAHAALEEVKTWVEANGLTLHPDKTHIGDCRIAGQGFEFLGYRFEAGTRRVKKKSLHGFKDKLRAKKIGRAHV